MQNGMKTRQENHRRDRWEGRRSWFCQVSGPEAVGDSHVAAPRGSPRTRARRAWTRRACRTFVIFLLFKYPRLRLFLSSLLWGKGLLPPIRGTPAELGIRVLWLLIRSVDARCPSRSIATEMAWSPARPFESRRGGVP